MRSPMEFRKIADKLDVESINYSSKEVHPLLMLVKQVGDIAQAMVYGCHKPECTSEYRQQIKNALAEAIAEINVIVDRMGLDMDELSDLGYERLCHKLRELR